jgi:hypothetical protein
MKGDSEIVVFSITADRFKIITTSITKTLQNKVIPNLSKIGPK